MGTPRADAIMLRMGFTAADQGPYVTELRGLIERQVREGLRERSAGTWATDPASIPAEERARSMLAFQWAIDNAYSYRRETLEPPVYWATNLRTLRRRLVVRWRRILPWLGDERRHAAFLLRCWWNKRVLKKRNPYAPDPSQ